MVLKTKIYLIGITALLVFTWTEHLEAVNYITYKIDYTPLMKTPKLYEELLASQKKAVKGDVTRGRLVRQINILESVLLKTPNWIDGLWLLSSDTFQLGSSYTDERDLAIARRILVKGRNASEHCLTVQPENPLCKLFLGSAIAKIGTIDGVFSSISHAERVKNLWVSVSRSRFNFQFTPYISMQGAVRYALGIFYRLVPDYQALEWMYGVKGDIEKSVDFHRASLAMDGKNLPCSNLMLGVAILCMAEDEDDDDDDQPGRAALLKAEGMSYLRAARKANSTFSVNSAICRADSLLLSQNPEEVCGYSIARQQEEVEESQITAK